MFLFWILYCFTLFYNSVLYCISYTIDLRLYRTVTIALLGLNIIFIPVIGFFLLG